MAELPRHIEVMKDVFAQSMQGEMVLLSMTTSHYYGLDEVGTRAWQLIADHIDPQQLVQQLLAEFDVDEATLRNDLARLIEDLAAAGLIACTY